MSLSSFNYQDKVIIITYYDKIDNSEVIFVLLEIIATTLSEALDIEKFGGHRIELVTGVSDGGLTPSIALADLVAKSVKIPVYAMLRPHSKSFVYDENDIKVILDDLKALTKTKVAGIVFGALNPNGTINEELLKLVIDNKKHLKLVFHRAIDQSNDVIKSTRLLCEYDVERILTSGGEKNAILGSTKINEMNDIAIEFGITILAGAGLTPHNIEEFLKTSNVSEVHMGSGVKYEGSNLKNISEELVKLTLKNIES